MTVRLQFCDESRDFCALRARRFGQIDDRQMNREDGAFSERAVDLEQAPMMIDDMLHDGEAEAGAAKLARAGGVDPVEALREPRDVLGKDALAVVADRDLRRGGPGKPLQ